MTNRDEYAACRDLLAQELANRYGVELCEFGRDTNDPGVRFDFDVGSVAVHGALWSNLSFDVEAVELERAKPVLAKSLQVAGPAELSDALGGAFCQIDARGGSS